MLFVHTLILFVHTFGFFVHTFFSAFFVHTFGFFCPQLIFGFICPHFWFFLSTKGKDKPMNTQGLQHGFKPLAGTYN